MPYDFPQGFSTTFTLTEDAKKLLACPGCGVYPVEECISDKKMRWGRVWYMPWRQRPAHAVTCKSCGKRIGWSWSVSIEQALSAIRKSVYRQMAEDLMSRIEGVKESK